MCVYVCDAEGLRDVALHQVKKFENIAKDLNFYKTKHEQYVRPAVAMRGNYATDSTHPSALAKRSPFKPTARASIR